MFVSFPCPAGKLTVQSAKSIALPSPTASGRTAPACGGRGQAPWEGAPGSRWPVPPPESCRCPAPPGRSAAEAEAEARAEAGGGQERFKRQQAHGRGSVWPAGNICSSGPLSSAVALAAVTRAPLHLCLCKAVAKAAGRQDVQPAAGCGGDDFRLAITIQVSLQQGSTDIIVRQSDAVTVPVLNQEAAHSVSLRPAAARAAECAARQRSWTSTLTTRGGGTGCGCSASS